jgi:O-methyltransferase
VILEGLRKAVRRTGFDVVRHPGQVHRDVPPDVSDSDRRIIEEVRPFTLTSDERLISLIAAVRFVVRSDIPGAITECGVWKGGSMMAAAKTLVDEGDTSRELYLYDTFEGMSEPTEMDKSFDGVTAEEQLAETPKGEGVWCYSSLDDVKENIASTGYPAEKVHFIKGKIEETIPHNDPPQMAILRLDTDWYESTRHELEHLFPLLAEGGFLIIDDYGHWEGARKAVDEFLAGSAKKYFLHRIDATGRLLIK